MGLQSSVKGFNLEAYQVIVSSASIALNSLGLTNIINVSEGGELSEIGIAYTAGATGTPTVTLEIQIDGQTTQTVPLLSAGVLMTDAAKAFVVQSESGGVGAAGCVFRLSPHTRYAVSCRVGINVSVQADNASVFKVSVSRGKKI